MQFWDTSAVVPLCTALPATSRVRRIAARDRAIVVWWGTPVEIQSALGRLIREGLNRSPTAQIARNVSSLRQMWREIVPSDHLRELAEELPARHGVSAGDAFQLAAALVWCSERPRGRSFVCLDHRLAGAAQAIGFEVVPVR